MQLLIIIGLVVIGAISYVTIQKPFEKREGEVTLGDLMEQSRRNVPGNTSGKKINPNVSVTPAIYSGTRLVSVPESDLALIRKGGAEVSFPTYVPSKIPKGFTIRPTSVRHGVQNGATVFQVIFSHKNSDTVFIYQYPLKEYLAIGGLTLEKYTNGAEEMNVAGKKAYISYISVTTARKYQYHQTISVIDGAVLIRIEYAGEEKLSNADLTELAASLIR